MNGVERRYQVVLFSLTDRGCIPDLKANILLAKYGCITEAVFDCLA